jgi:protein-S-isoprenylcysteine O-methyltransferase Ste14
VEEYLRFPLWLQAIVVTLLGAVLVVAAVTSVVDGWEDWVVLGGILVAVLGMAIAISNRRYPTRKRTFTKDSDSKW